jgi:Icc protein
MATIELLQITDPHLFGDPSRRLYGLDTADSLRQVLATALAEGRPDAIVATGDIGDDCSEASYRQFRRALGDWRIPVYCLPGNHDDPVLMAEVLADPGFQYCGRARLGAWGVVFLDTHLPGSPSGRLQPAEIGRFEADVLSFDDAPVLICLHHPPVPVGSAWLDACGLENSDEFCSVLDHLPQVRAVIAGHVHQEFEARRGRVRLLTTPSTCAQFTPRTVRCVMDRRPPGYRWIRLHDDGLLETRVAWLPALLAEPLQEDEARRLGQGVDVAR